MGCFQSKVGNPTSFPGKLQKRSPNGAGASPEFAEFSLAELKAATANFSSESVVSEGGEKAPNFVYKGRLQNRRLIAVKKFSKLAWPDPKQFVVF